MHNETMATITAIIITFTFLIAGSAKLKVDVKVPRYRLRGELAILQCLFNLENGSVYSVKWYKDNEEFFRYVPRSDPKIQSYKLDGVKVDHTLSDSRQVALKPVNLKSTGTYKCEVSGEGPNFESDNAEKIMEVIYMPNHGPHISMDKKYYLKNEEFEANCTSAKSFPATVLKWFINDLPVDDNEWLIEYPAEKHAHRLLTTTVGLRGIAYPEYFVKGNMKLKCVASLSPMLWQGSGESTLQSMSDILDGREAMLLVRGTSMRIALSTPLLALSLFLVTS